MKNCLVIFAKEPRPGKVKTRLQAALGRKFCLELYKAFLADTLKLSKNIPARKILAFDSGRDLPRYLKKAAPGFKFYRQKGRGLGAKLHNAFKFSSSAGYAKTLIIGVDSPSLPAGNIKEAYRNLNDNDIVLGPCKDGGFYLIGARQPCAGVLDNVPWGNSGVLKRALKNARTLGKKVSLLGGWYDVDRPADLELLRTDLLKNKRKALCTRKLLEL